MEPTKWIRNEHIETNIKQVNVNVFCATPYGYILHGCIIENRLDTFDSILTMRHPSTHT